jgi:predicted Co/Zn/Cd cation transporter (cation efflux family)
MYDSYGNAREPYGKILNGFLIVEGWHLRSLLLVMMNCLLCSICIVAVTTAASDSLDAGLAAGSYAVGFGATGIAILTFLSAIL